MVLQWCELFHVSLHCLIEEWDGLIAFLGSFLSEFKINMFALSSMLKIGLTNRYIKCCS